MMRITEEVEELIKTKSPRMARVYRDCGVFHILDSNPAMLYKNYGKNLSYEAIACMITDIFVNDERITNIMSIKRELAKTATITKTDLTFIVAESLGIGRNKASAIIDQIITNGYFIVLPNVYDVNAKMIRPAKMSENELMSIYERICSVNGIEITKEGFENFMAGL